MAEGSQKHVDNTWICFVKFPGWVPSLWTDLLEKEIVGFIENRAVVFVMLLATVFKVALSPDAFVCGNVKKRERLWETNNCLVCPII